VREALFSILGNRVPGSRFLDLYAGTGAVGIEALSRGAVAVTLVESDPKAVRLMRKNLTSCQFNNVAHVRLESTQNFFQHPESWQGPYDLLFADPPYADASAVDLVLTSWKLGLLSTEGRMIIEQDARAQLPASTEDAELLRRYVYGDTALFVYGPAKLDRVAS
jgi:16S rRNA (guanine(966)-N(2))-methyltransferase RsmD